MIGNNPSDVRSKTTTTRLDEGIIPTTVRFNSTLRTFTAVPLSKCTHVLIDVISGVNLSGPVVYNLRGTSVASYLVAVGSSTAVYYDTAQRVTDREIDVRSILAQHLSGREYLCLNAPCADQLVWDAFPVPCNRRYRDIESILDAPATKISSEHHVHFTPRVVYTTLSDSQKVRALEAARLPGDAPQAMVSGVMLWLASLDDWSYRGVAESGLLDSETFEHFGKAAKLASVHCKMLQNIVSRDLLPLFEMDVLVNRVFGSPDWESERLHRTKPKLASVPRKEIFDRSRRIFQQAKREGRQAREMDWEAFWATRWQWAATGTIFSQHSEDNKYIPKERELKNKFYSLISRPSLPFETIIRRERCTWARSSTKYEWGKMRAIYGVDLTNYLLSNFAFFNCEETLSSVFPVGSRANEKYVSAAVDAISTTGVAYCIDFEDFNSQHSLGSMKAVIDAWLAVYASDLSEDQYRAALWVRDAIDKTLITDNMGLKTTYQAAGTLLSGWRLTTFMNSVLNRVYSEIMFDGSGDSHASVHNGDDVLAYVKSFGQVCHTIRNSETHGIRLQRAKCNFGSLEEFLRVDRAGGGYGQYLCRNIATLVHSRIESKKAVSVVDMIEAMEMRLGEFVQRKGDVELAIRLRSAYYDTVISGYGLTSKSAELIRLTHRAAGGISTRPNAGISVQIISKQASVMPGLSKVLPGERDYAVQLVKQLSLNVNLKRAAESISSATRKALMLAPVTVTITAASDLHQLRVWRALYKAHAYARGDASFGKAKLIGYALDVAMRKSSLYLLSRAVSGSTDPLKALSILV